VHLTSDVANNAVVLNCNKLSAKFRANHFRYKVAPLIVAKGYVEVDMASVDIGFGLVFKTQISPDGRQIMAVDTVDVIVNIDKNDIKLHIGGGFWEDLASIFEVFFKGTVVDEIRDQVKNALTTIIPQVTNKALIDNDGYADFTFTNLWWDWESPIAANVTETNWQFNVKGLFFDNRTGEINPTGVVPPANMPAKDEANPAKLQMFLSTYVLDSAFYSGLSVYDQYATIWVNSSDVSDSGLYPFNTSNVDELLGGIESYYGPNVPVNMKLNLKKIDNVTVSEKE